MTPIQDRLRATAEGLRIIAMDLDEEASLSVPGTVGHAFVAKLRAHALLIRAAADVIEGKSEMQTEIGGQT